jgi:hypothetical protein
MILIKKLSNAGRAQSPGRTQMISFIMISLFLMLSLLLPGEVSAQKPASPSTFRASVVKIDITPDDSQNLLGYGARISTGTHDPIFHKINVLDDGITQFFLISSDICLISPSEYDRVAAKIKKLYGIDPVNVWWTVRHTHSAPEVGPPGMGATFLGDRFLHEIDPKYTELVEQKLIDGVNESRKQKGDLKPCALSTPGSEHDERNVKLIGEALFEVTRDPDHLVGCQLSRSDMQGNCIS